MIKMIEEAAIAAALNATSITSGPAASDVPSQDDEVMQYVVSLLQDEESYDDLVGLTDTIQSLLELEERSVAEKLVQSLVPPQQQSNNGAPTNSQTVPATTSATPHAPNSPIANNSEHNSAGEIVSASSSSSSEDEAAASAEQLSPKSHKAQRKAKRKQRQERKKKQSKDDNTTTTSTTDIQHVVAQINAASAQELNEMDDYSSAWKQVQEQAAQNNNQDVVWGGRGAGGRGVNRGLNVYRGKDAVVQQLTLSFGGRDLLHETHLIIAHGHRYGLMGQNGVGKSTLLHRMAAGSIPGWPLHLSVRMVEQEVLGSPKSVVECMQEISQGAQNNQRKQALEEEIAELERVLEDTNTSPEDMEAAADRLSEAYDQLESMEAENNSDNDASSATKSGAFSKLDARARKILKGLQFPASLLEVPGNTLSGGWRMRLDLAQALYAEPDILLLDEPTNHLDLSAILFLENYIVDKDLTVVVVSHDGHFLDAICTDMIKFEDCKLKYHVGNYTSFREREEQTWARNCSKADAAARQEKKAKEFIQKQRSMANSKRRDDNKMKQAAERQKKLGRIGLYSENGQKFKLLAEGNTKRGGSNRAGHIFANYTNARGMQSAFVKNEQVAFGEDKQQLNFKFPSAPPLKGGGTQMITMEGCRFRYDTAESSDWLLQDMSLNVSYGSRIAIVGKNGAGKSTLLNIMSGELQVQGGEFHRHPNLKVAHIAQHHIEQLADYLTMTPVDYFMQQHHAKSGLEARQFLGGFGLVGPLALQKIGTLSGGQKARLAFATVMYTEPHVLILDEPTNHLDSDSLESLALAVEKFQGAVVVVSHNQDFMSRCCQEMWTVANGRVKVEVADGEMTTFDDLFEHYKESLRKEARGRKK